ncbi:GTP pyrophosphokinase, (p)ppGpp synthetase II / Guanosine-3',5'-bis(diphosphate) 3'-pyrophosphohydrolase [hydrothermal vent metagenome]|uniref:GTP pyrophosphokinase, (P)ppGpp synthetase II / Guanosine-3',5'-bis(Diphosphate) 3'-pyrophosphohydrolase n=1 Tax=hydrothermal vent metagenome TaxID=652676 RepID=A0A1W1EKV0_9ZZZZ
MDKFLEDIKVSNSIDSALELLYRGIKSTPMIEEAITLSINSHEGQVRKSGEPYIVHPILVASITAYMNGDEDMVVASILHDVVEDTHITIEEVSLKFGKKVAHLVSGLTKIDELKEEEVINSSSNDKLIKSALTFRKMVIASIHDPRVLLIKLCDRLHNLLTLDALPHKKQIRISEESLVVYAPIAHRLGISKIKNLIEDLSFSYIYPKEYEIIDNYVKSNKQDLHLKLNDFMDSVKDNMHKNGFEQSDFALNGRVKHYYSIYLKMQRKGVSIEEVLDLLAVRIIVKEAVKCYEVLGLLHLNFTPLISRFKDYIALPKENGYKTIHTTLFNKNSIIEAQIRTYEMDALAEFGIAAHWKYKGGDDNDINLKWLESLSYQNNSPEEFYELAKSDLFSEEITVLSPKGDAYTLPRGSTALDFAYSIHSDIGNNASGVMINSVKSSLLTILKNGDIVNIIMDGEPRLRCSWEDTVKSSKAKHGIRTRCRNRLKETNITTTYNMLSTIFDSSYIYTVNIIKELGLNDILYRVPNELTLYQDIISKFGKYIGKSVVRPWEFMKRGYKIPTKIKKEHFIFYTNKDIKSINFDYCCHPKFGDEIVAFNYPDGVTIHHKLCKKAFTLINDNHNMIFVQWNSTKVSKYKLIISLKNRKGELAYLLNKLSQYNINVTSIDLGISSSDSADYCTIEIESKESNRGKLTQKLEKHFKLIELSSLDDAYNR